MARLRSSYAVHLWNQMWKSHEQDSDILPPADSLYGLLRERYAAVGRTSRGHC
jgi:hypothetical protein